MSYTQWHSMSVAETVSPKRKRSSQGPYKADNSSLILNKRQIVDSTTRQAQHAARERFWNTISSVWLTPRSLREFDRRNAVQSLEPRCSPDLELSKSPCIDTSVLSPASLKNLKRFARRGGPSLVGLRGCLEPSRPSLKTMSSLGSSSPKQKRLSKSSNTFYSSGAGQTLKSSAYDRNFEQKCIDHDIHMPYEDNEPENWQQLQDRLAHSRLSLSPSQFSDEEFKRFRKIEAEARNENDVVRNSLPIILGKRQRDYTSAGDVPFRNIDDMAPDMFKKPTPDLYWGARPTQIDRRVRQDLNHQIVPSTNESYPAAPNFFLETKGPNGSAAINTRQACYDGALGARAMNALQEYGQAEPIYDNKAYAISSTYYDGQLKMYSHHRTQPSRPGGSSQYHMSQLNSYALTGDAKTFRRGVGAFRNARDLTREQSDMLIDRANAVARAQFTDTMSFDESNSQDTITSLGRRLVESDTSADELVSGHPIQ